MVRYQCNGLKQFRTGGIAVLELGELNNGRRVIHRRLQEKFRFDWRIRKRFVRGINIRQALPPHVNLVGSIEIGGGLLPYELIDYVDGVTMEEWRVKQSAYVDAFGTRILLQAANAIFHVHRNGYLHLDIKPGNFLIEGDPENSEPNVKLTDFDLAVTRKKHKADKSQRMGTFNYMPPEMLKDGQIGIGADIFAYGVTAYHFYTGKMPYPGDNAADSRRYKTDVKFVVPTVQEVHPAVHRRTSELIMKCLHPEPSIRLSSIELAVRELKTLQGH